MPQGRKVSLQALNMKDKTRLYVEVEVTEAAVLFTIQETGLSFVVARDQLQDVMLPVEEVTEFLRKHGALLVGDLSRLTIKPGDTGAGRNVP